MSWLVGPEREGMRYEARRVRRYALPIPPVFPLLSSFSFLLTNVAPGLDQLLAACLAWTVTGSMANSWSTIICLRRRSSELVSHCDLWSADGSAFSLQVYREIIHVRKYKASVRRALKAARSSSSWPNSCRFESRRQSMYKGVVDLNKAE